jgi:hypothetical protein
MRTHKGGRPAFKPTEKQRQRIACGVACGLTLEQLALDVDVPVTTMRRAFANEIKTGRVKVILDNLDVLAKASRRGNISAARTLLKMTMIARPDELEADDPWADVASNAPVVLDRNSELH